jgi:hypothetical protein
MSIFPREMEFWPVYSNFARDFARNILYFLGIQQEEMKISFRHGG